MHRFFEEGDKVKITLRFRGRELAHPELGMKLLQKVKADFEPVAKVEYEPRMEGRQMIMILAAALSESIVKSVANGIERGLALARLLSASTSLVAP